jgi:hypothetical protein
MDRLWLETVAGFPTNDPALPVLKLLGYLIPAPAGRIRLLLKPHCLDFAIADVECVDEIDAGYAPLPGAIRVEVTLRKGAPLLAFQDADALHATSIAGAVPFAVATRPSHVMSPPCPNYARAEREYLQRHRIVRE